MADITHLFGGSFEPPVQQKITKTPEDQFLDDIIAAGLIPPNGIIFDGQLRRFVCAEGAKGKQNGWYIAYDGRIKAGAFGDWRTDFKQTWREDIGRQLDMSEGIEFQRQMKEAKAKAEAERKAKQEEAAETAQSIWDRSTPAPEDHPYLVKKGVKPHGIRLDGMRLVIPIRDADKVITSLQHIDMDGNKRFLKGGAVAGGRFIFNGGSNTVYLAEGFATGASIYEATGSMVVVAFSANQLAPVAESIRSQYPSSTLVIVADNDEAGAKAAQEAANAARAHVVTIPTPGMDANDYAQSGEDLVELLAPKKPESKLKDLDDLIGQESKVSWLIKNYMVDYGLSMIFGPSQAGKTFAVIDLALRMATGKTDWFGFKLNKRAKILYLAGEGQHGIRNRAKAWALHHGISSFEGYVKIFDVPVDINGDGMMELIANIDASGFSPDLIIADTLNRYFSGNENSSDDTREFMNACTHIENQYSTAMMVIHHTGVSDEAQHRNRGSSAWGAGLECNINVSRDKDGETIVISHVKNKEGPRNGEVYGRLVQVGLNEFDEDGEEITSAVIIEATKPDSKSDKKSAQLAKDEEWFLDAWNKSGCESGLAGGKYVSSSFLRDHLITYGMTNKPGSASQWTKPAAKSGPLHRMAENELIFHEREGWVMMENIDVTVDNLINGSKIK